METTNTRATKRTKGYVEPDGKIYARVCWTDSEGKRRQSWRIAESKSHARELGKEMRGDIDQCGPDVLEHATTTLGDYLDRWLRDAAKSRVSERTHEDYTHLLKRHIRPALGKKTLAALKPLDIQSIYTAMRESGLSSRTVRYVHAVLHCALKQALKWGLLARNPAAMVDLPKQTRREMRVLTSEQARELLVAARSERHGLVIAFALASGMRPEEYLALRWPDLVLNPAAPSATVQRVIRFTRKTGWSFGEPKTRRSRRTVPLPASLVEWLKHHKRAQAEERLKAGADWNDHDLVFCALNGSPLSLRNFERRHFTPLLKRLEIPRITVYGLRHSCASLMLATNEHPKVVSERLGHSSTVLTMDTYSHVLPGVQEAATDRLDSLLFKVGDYQVANARRSRRRSATS